MVDPRAVVDYNRMTVQQRYQILQRMGLGIPHQTLMLLARNKFREIPEKYHRDIQQSLHDFGNEIGGSNKPVENWYVMSSDEAMRFIREHGLDY